MADEALPVIQLPFWARIVVGIVRVIGPLLGLPGWIITLLPFILGIIEALPSDEKRKAKAEIAEAVRALRNGRKEPIEQVTAKYWKKRCEGVACTADLKRD